MGLPKSLRRSPTAGLRLPYISPLYQRVFTFLTLSLLTILLHHYLYSTTTPVEDFPTVTEPASRIIVESPTSDSVAPTPEPVAEPPQPTINELTAELKKTVGPPLRRQLLYPNFQNGSSLTCAVVGESTSLYTGPRLYNKEIDAHDVVVRLPVAEGSPWYRKKQVPIRGAKVSFEVHHTHGKDDWVSSSGSHRLCGAHEGAPLLLTPELCTPAMIRSMSDGCEDGVAREFAFLTDEEAEIMHKLHRAVERNASVLGSTLPFTEEWLATYAALAICDEVNLYGVVTETINYQYGEKSEELNTAPSTDTAAWTTALDLLNMTDVSHKLLVGAMQQPNATAPLPRKQLEGLRLKFSSTRKTFFDSLGYAGANKSCVVVGAGPDTRGKGWGKWVDAHDLVWRCNYHIPDISDESVVQDQGTRTDILFALRTNINDPKFIKAVKNMRGRNPVAFGYLYPPPDKYWAEPETPLRAQADYRFADLKYIDTAYKWLRELSFSTQVNGWFFHSTGHLATNLAMLMCNSTAAMGFGLGRLTLLHHGFVLESTLLELYRQAGLMDVRMPEDVSRRLRGYLRNMVESGVIRLPLNPVVRG